MNILGIFLDSTEIWLLAGAGACLAWIVPHRLSFWRERRSRLANAATIFRAAIDPSVFIGLRGHLLHGALIKVFPKHRDAAHEFRRYLGAIDRLHFSNAWKAYHGGSEENPDWFVLYCLPTNGAELLAQRLERLRDVAGQT